MLVTDSVIGLFLTEGNTRFGRRLPFNGEVRMVSIVRSVTSLGLGNSGDNCSGCSIPSLTGGAPVCDVTPDGFLKVVCKTSNCCSTVPNSDMICDACKKMSFVSLL